MPITLTKIAIADPRLRFTQARLLQELSRRRKLSPREKTLYTRFLLNKSIAARSFAVKELDELLRDDPAAQQSRFSAAAAPLSSRALKKALRLDGTSGDEIGCIATATCTGYLCPGLSSYLMQDAGLPEGVFAIDLGGMGCAAALPALQAVCAYLAGHPDSRGAVVCTEICSSLLCWEDLPELILSNSIFADGSAACILKNDGTSGLEVVGFASETRPGLRDMLRLRHENGRLKNVLSVEVPRVAAAAVKRLCSRLLEEHGLSPGKIGAWALHPGGMNVLDSLKESLGIKEQDLAFSRRTLALHGNLSSPSILYVLSDIMARVKREGTHVLASAFGAGFSAHACLLRIL